jgi:transcriptional regulator with XRE-family HTH domain
MAEPTTLGSWLRRERERRGITLAQIAEDTKVAVPLLQGLEADDLSRWPGGIFRRAFARSYATAIGLDAEMVVQRIEEEHPTEDAEATMGGRRRVPDQPPAAVAAGPSAIQSRPERAPAPSGIAPRRLSRDQIVGLPIRLRATAAALELLIGGAIGFGFAAAGSRLLWPVLIIAAYYAAGVLLTGTTPMVALLAQPHPAEEPAAAKPAAVPAPAPAAEAVPAPRRTDEPRAARRARARRAQRHEQAAARH